MAIEKLSKPIYLLQDISTNITSEPVVGTGSHAIFQITATNFGTASITIQGNTDPTTMPWVTLLKSNSDPAIFTANFLAPLYYFSQSLYVRAIVSGADGATSGIYVRAII